MSDLFYTPAPEEKPDLVARLLRMAGFEYQPVSEVPKFEQGENVKMEDGFVGEIGGYVKGEPYIGVGNGGEEWFYPVEVYDSEGPRGLEVWPEHTLYRPKSYDAPGETTMEDWMDIPPAAEEYYRTAGADEWGDMFANPMQEVMRARPFAFIHSPAEKWIKWTGPNGLHQEIENSMWQNGQRVPDDAVYGRYYPQGGPGASGQVPPGHVEIYDGRIDQNEKDRITNLVRLNAPDH